MIEPKRIIFSLRTPHIEAMISFYEGLLGAPVQTEPGKWASFQLPGSELTLWRAADFQPRDGGVQICLVVDDLVKTLEGLKPEGPTQISSHGEEAFVRDPDGNTLILYQPR